MCCFVMIAFHTSSSVREVVGESLRKIIMHYERNV